MYGGQIALITNREDWVSDFYQLTDEDTGEIVNIANPDIGFDAKVYIMDLDGCQRSSITMESGNVFIADAEDGPGIQWVYPKASLGNLCAGTWRCGLKLTVNGLDEDLLVGTLVIEDGLR